MQRSTKKEQTPQEFAKEHWVEILAASGTLVGAVIYLLIRYHKKRRELSGDSASNTYLDNLGEDALKSQREPVPLLLDIMPEVSAEIPDAAKLSEQLAEGLPSKVTGKKSQLRWFRGSPQQVMSDAGKIK